MGLVIFNRRGGLLYVICELYIDGILVYASTKGEFVTRIRQIFDRMRTYNFNLNPYKFSFGMPAVEFVMHLVSSEGINFTDAKKKKVIYFKTPATHKEMKSFLGLTNYCRDHIYQYSLSKPLQDMVLHNQPGAMLQWTSTSTHEFTKCKDAINNCPTLAFLDIKAPITLETDASDYGIGAYLYQTQDDKQVPTAFLSKALSAIQQR